MEQLNIGLIGAGWVTQHHLRAWSKQRNAKVVAICDPDIEAAKSRGAEFGIAAVYADAEEMISQANLHAVDIASPRKTHADLVRLAARNGLQVLCQKPLAPTLQEAEQLIADVGGAVRLMVHENWRYRPYYRKIKEWLDAGLIGTPRQCLMTLFSSGMIADASGVRPLLARQPFMATLDRLLVTEVLIHHLDTLRFLVGELVVEDAVLDCITPGLKGEDMATVTLSNQQGARTVLLGNAAAAGYPPNIVDQLSIMGDKGSVFLKGDALQLVTNEEVTIRYDLPAAYQESYDAAIGHFVSGLQTGNAFETDARENLQTMKIVEDIYRLSAERR